MSNSIASALQGSNSFDLAPPDNNILIAQAKAAVANDIKSGELYGTAGCRMAYAVMGHCAALIANGEKIARLDAVLVAGSTEPRADIVQHMIKHFPLFETVKTDDLSDAANKIRSRNSANRRLLDRGITLAALATKFNVPFSAFNAKTGLLAFPAELFYAKDNTPSGRLRAGALIPLDGDVCLSFDKAGSPKRIKASESYLVATFVPKKPVGAQTPDKAKQVSEAEKTAAKATKAVVDALTIDVVAQRMAAILVNKKTTFDFDALSSTVQTNLTSIMGVLNRAYEAHQKAEAEAKAKAKAEREGKPTNGAQHGAAA